MAQSQAVAAVGLYRKNMAYIWMLATPPSPDEIALPRPSSASVPPSITRSVHTKHRLPRDPSISVAEFAHKLGLVLKNGGRHFMTTAVSARYFKTC